MHLRLLFLAVFFTAVYAKEYPLVPFLPPKCDPDVIAKIKQYWADHGNPPEIFTKKGERWSNEYSSATKLWTDVKCEYYIILKKGLLFVSKDDKNGTVEISQTGGILHMQGDKDQHYIIIGNKEIVAIYTCNDDGPEVGSAPPIAYVMSSPIATKCAISKAVKIEESVGLKLPKKFDCPKTAPPNEGEY